ncbi:hypothetical protein GQ457_03G029490 [Hibiscus cannabinus]
MAMASFEMNDRKKIGLGLTGFGIFFFVSRNYLLFRQGIACHGKYPVHIRGDFNYWSEVYHAVFHEASKFEGNNFFGVGFFFVVIGWPIIGMVLEAYGFVVLFSGFWPTLAVFLQRIPILGWLFQQPYIRSLLERYRGRRVPV